MFSVAASSWDLPLKRNYALWHAQERGFDRILLLDDDIRGLSQHHIRASTNALSRWTLTGYFVEDFPDTSVLGHVMLALGDPLRTFLSGSCLFIRTSQSAGLFPPIYNEDWIFMAPEIANGRVCSLGEIHQEPYDPFATSSLSEFQEPGELVADGLFALLAAGTFRDRFSTDAWTMIRSKRLAWLTLMAGRARDERHRLAVAGALARCRRINATECVDFVRDVEHDQTRWSQILRELR